MKKFLFVLIFACSFSFCSERNEKELIVREEKPLSHRIITKGTWFGCTTQEEHDKIVEYLIREDKEAFVKAITAGVLRGTIMDFKGGQEVFIVESGGFFSDVVKIRRKGEIEEYWIFRKALTERK